MSMSLCLFVCLFVCLSVFLSVSESARITPKPHDRSLPYILCMLPVVVARSSYGGVAIRYVLPALWMTSCFVPWANRTESSTALSLEGVRQVTALEW